MISLIITKFSNILCHENLEPYGTMLQPSSISEEGYSIVVETSVIFFLFKLNFLLDLGYLDGYV